MTKELKPVSSTLEEKIQTLEEKHAKDVKRISKRIDNEKSERKRKNMKMQEDIINLDTKLTEVENKVEISASEADVSDFNIIKALNVITNSKENKLKSLLLCRKNHELLLDSSVSLTGASVYKCKTCGKIVVKMN